MDKYSECIQFLFSGKLLKTKIDSERRRCVSCNLRRFYDLFIFQLKI